MRVYDLYFVDIVEPLGDLVTECMEIVDKSLNVYTDRIEKYTYNHWSDDSELLKDLLNENSKNSIIEWSLIPAGNGDPVDWYIHSASVLNGGTIGINLDGTTIEENFGPKTFRRTVRKTISHESIHVNQRKVMGEYLFDSITSGYTRGSKILKETKNIQDLFDQYFSDPTEIMAHGHDLAFEIFHHKDRVNIMENIGKYSDILPTLHRHINRGFPINHPVTKKMMEYSRKYFERMGK